MDIEEYAKKGEQFYTDEIPPLLTLYLNRESWKTYLDCGCGDGSLLHALNVHGIFKNKIVYAIDLSKNRIDLIKKINPHILASVDNVEKLKTIKSGSIDIVVSTQVIEHVDDKKMINQIYRVLKKGGTVYLSTVFKKWYGWYYHRNEGKWVMDPTHKREYSSDTMLLKLFDPTSFELLENKKTLIWYPIIDFIIKRIHLAERDIYNKSVLFNFMRKIKVPIFGYYNWELVFKKI